MKKKPLKIKYKYEPNLERYTLALKLLAENIRKNFAKISKEADKIK